MGDYQLTGKAAVGWDKRIDLDCIGFNYGF